MIQFLGDIHPANLEPTVILNHDHPIIRVLVVQLNHSCSELSSRAFVQTAHRDIQNSVRPIYTINELQPASVTLERKQGSCSQRIAALEAISRAHGIPTRVRGLWVDGRFWYPRFGVIRYLIPKRILVAWPQFYLEDPSGSHWVDFDDLFVSVSNLVDQTKGGFTNTGETLFEAIEHTLVDFLGKSKNCKAGCNVSSLDLSKYVLADEGFFDTRDDLFARCCLLQETLRGRAFEFFYGGRATRR